MRLERVEISGFKSFVDRTEVEFPQGITAIVGPNGCGKSNIGDAINWVLGEQSPRMLRGKEMADVIFAGSEARKPVGMAEVSLTLSGLATAGPGDEESVVVTRRLHRDGESEYLLNGGRSRLKDIQEVLDKAHVGARTYATIEQGRIEQILSAKPKDRRLLIEDAAGIAGYKHKRRLTELKLEATQANLLRVQDVVAEVERQIRALRRQAGRARRYRRLRDELRRQETSHVALRAERLDRELAECSALERQARDAESAAAARVATLEAGIASERAAIEEADRQHREHAERGHRLDLELDRQDAQLESLRQRIGEAEDVESRQAAEGDRLAAALDEAERDHAERAGRAVLGQADLARIRDGVVALQQRVERAQEERRVLGERIERLRVEQFDSMRRGADARNGLRAAEEARARLEAQRARLEADRSEAGADLFRWEREDETLARAADEERERLEALRGDLASLAARLDEARGAEAAAADALGAAREEHRSAATRLATLEDVATRFAGVSDGVRAVLAEGPAAGVRAHGVVADYIEAGREIEALAESYLEAFLPTVIVEDDLDLERAVDLVRRHGAGRTGLLARTRPVGGLAVGVAANGHGGIPSEVLSDPRVRGRLRDRLDLRAAGNGVLHDRLGDAVVVQDLAAGLDLHRRHPAADYVTLDGEVVHASGLVWAGRRSAADHGLLAHKRRTNEARTAEAEARERTSEIGAQLEARRAERAGLEAAERELRDEIERRARALVELEVGARRARDERERTGRRTEVLSGEIGAIADEALRLARLRVELEAAVELAESGQGALEVALTEATAALDAAERESSSVGTESAAAREDLAARMERQEALEQAVERLLGDTVELRARVAAARSEAEAARARASDAAEQLARLDAEHATAVRAREDLSALVERLGRGLDERRAGLVALEFELRTGRESLDGLREATGRLALDRTRAEAARVHLDELAQTELGLDAATAGERAREAGIDLGAVDPATIESAMAELRGKLEALGPVNMTAVDEFAELETRQQFLHAQRQDLEQAMASLRETIRRINRSTRETFLQAFEAIRASYQEVFQLLFRGGRADLRLEEGDDVLEAGVEILVQPPGKRLSNLSLMSGGEKSLSAIALLFAIFRYQPSPFCLLDEVDAALDDVNVGRFTRMVAEFAEETQFIIVTHNKVTMEAARLLYGVTMQEPGVSKLMSLQLQ